MSSQMYIKLQLLINLCLKQFIPLRNCQSKKEIYLYFITDMTHNSLPMLVSIF